MGAGEGLQDFILIWKLFQMGIWNIEICLIEPEYRELLNPEKALITRRNPDWLEESPIPISYYQSYQHKVYSIINALSVLNKCHDKANITISLYSSIHQLKTDMKNNETFDIIYGIDLEDYSDKDSSAYQDFNQSLELLSNKGQAFLSHHYCIETFVAKKTMLKTEFKHDLIDMDRVLPINQKYQVQNSAKNFFQM